MTNRERQRPVAVTDVECDPPYAVTSYGTRAGAEWYLRYLRKHGGTETRKKIDRGGYEIREKTQ